MPKGRPEFPIYALLPAMLGMPLLDRRRHHCDMGDGIVTRMAEDHFTARRNHIGCPRCASRTLRVLGVVGLHDCQIGIGGNRKLWIERIKKLGPIARDLGVKIVVKQHGGSTGTGDACAKIVREVNDPGIMVNYDAGNVMDYLNVDPIPDIRKCADVIHSFCIKDHRNWPKDQDCGPGLGEIDHYRLLHPVAFTGRTIPLCCENIFAPLVARPSKPEGIDALARRARVFLETVIAGLHA